MRAVRALTGLALAAGVAFGPPAAAKQPVTPPVPGESGMPTQVWFKTSSLDLRRDLEETVRAGKILAIVWEQRGCYYCKQMHEVNFQIHEVVDYLRDNFEFVQLNLWGDRAMRDLAGKPTVERALARGYRVTGTPTIQFLDKDGNEVFRMPGYARPALFLTVFEYVAERAYETQSLEQYVRAKIARLSRERSGARVN